MVDKPLSIQEQRFVDEYLIDLDVVRASLAAGIKLSVAKCQAYQWVAGTAKPHVYNAIQKALKERSERTRIAADRVLEEIAKIGFSDIRKAFTAGGNLMPLQDLDDDMASCLSSVEVVTRRVPGGEEAEVEHVAKIKLWDKLNALEKLGKHLGLFNDKPVEPDKPDTSQISSAEAARRIAFMLTKGAKAAS